MDDDDNIIGIDGRDNIHKKGLLHREIHVWLYNNNGEVVLQRRSKNKDTKPGLLTASVGGHPNINESYLNAALRELLEETGIKANKNDLIYLSKIRVNYYDKLTNKTNNTIRVIYAYNYEDDLDKLVINKQEVLNFELWPLKKILNIPEKEKREFTISIFGKKSVDIFNQIRQLIK